MQRRLLGIPGLKLLCLCLALPYCSCLPDGDLCKWMNGRKYYIDVGESGLISAENVTSQSKLGEPQIPQRCSVELITCPSCHFEIHLRRLAIPTCATDSTCRCDFLWIKEAAFTKSGQEYCGFKRNDSAVLIYESKTKLVSVDFLYSGSYTDAFALQFSAKKNVYVHKGGYEYYQSNNTGLIRSPNFPGGYPSDYSAEYILQNIDTTGFVQLLFTDFQLSLWSYLEILDSNGSRIDVYNGNTFRPPAVISSGPTMTVKFQANDEYPSSGFKAKFTFVSYPEKYWINRPSTDCGGFVEDNGGGITMMNMVPSNSLRAFDCIWLIRPRNSHIPETQISVRVAQFEEMGPKSTLTIHEGLHSEAPLLESVTTFQHHKMPRGQEYVVPATHGFYIRLVGHFNNKSHLAIIYTTFRYDGCYAVGDFECENGRCIKNALRCDGFNHCGDGSDEASCYGASQGTPSPDDANWWRTLTPNYYFPKPDGNSSAGTNTLILVTSLAGLGMFVLTTVVILVKLHKQRQDDSISREILPTVSADVDSESSPNHHGTSDPPLYDPPPSYEDVIKFYLPPPPAYSSISSRTQHPSQATVSGGADNVGFRSDSPVAIRGRGRRTRVKLHRWVMQEAPQPMILRVSLPSEVRPVPVATSTKTTCSDMNGVLQGNTNLPIPEVVLRNAKPRSSDKELIEEHSHCENISSGVQCTTNNVKLSHTSRCKSSLQSEFCAVKPLPSDAEHICNDTEKTNSVLTTTRALSCECQGACTCTLQDETLAEVTGGSKRCQQRNSVATKEGQFCRKKESITESTSDQQSIAGSSGSGIIAHPTPMVITVSPSRFLYSVKKIPNEMGSRSEGPSSPTTLFAKQSKNFGNSNGEKFSSLSRLGHRRSSSGPLEKLCSQDLTMNAQPKIINSPDNRLKQCEPNVNFFQEGSNLSQVKHLASTLLGGLHQTLNFQNNGCERTIDSSAESLNKAAEKKDKNILPVTWSTSIWNPVRKRPERCESYKFEGGKYSWPHSDTQPLLKKVASQPQLGNRSVNKKNDSLGETQITNNII